MPLLRGNLHTHTRHSDGVFSPEEVIGRYKALGYDFLAITDHADRISDAYWSLIPRDHPDLLVFVGAEIDYRPLGQHVGRIPGDRETLHILNHPARYRLSVEETLTRIELLRADGLPIDAVEVTSTGLYQPQYDVEALPLPKVATDDAHREGHFGKAWIEVEALRRRDAILRAIKAGEFRLGFATAPAPPGNGTGRI
jgi:predicted metal-dependent phosphoesterase TrpH